MIRVVLDTNILISALLSPHGLPAQVFLVSILDPDTQLCVSGDVFAEYEEVIRRPRFSRSDSEIVNSIVQHPFSATCNRSCFWNCNGLIEVREWN
jgi:putative PIN family toxin of toxin-antitoxin system